MAIAKAAITDDDEYYSYVAYAFLEGLFFDKMKPLRKHMVSNPKAVLERGNLTVKVTKAVNSLKNANADSRAKIEAKWNDENPYFMMDAIMLWMDDAGKQLVKAKWPPL